MANKYTLVWKKPGTRDPLREAGPFDLRNAFEFIFANQPCLVEAVRVNTHAHVKLTNEQCRDRAQACLDRGNPGDAMRWYNTAAARTIGHGKTEQYQVLAQRCAYAGAIQYAPGEYMDQGED